MTRDALVTPTRAALAAGTALALLATVPAVAAAPAESAAPNPAPAATPTPKRATPEIRVTSSRSSGVVGRRAVYRGRVTGGPAGIPVRLEMRRGGEWRAVARDKISSKGRFRVSTRISRTGDRAARLRIVGRASVVGDRQKVSRVRGFRRAVASYFGPGLYGSALACGGRLTPGTIGVAHKTLPCGTRLTLRVGSRQVSARVVDRGPYVGGREFDLTAATRSRLGFGSVGTVLVDK